MFLKGKLEEMNFFKVLLKPQSNREKVSEEL